ncbi:MAG: methyl-accepting chemotaxis protein, partial [Planctomycetes bacterium]|nr:methyl-accepting chemotaxis protein [Planctomycetota bacterium]
MENRLSQLYQTIFGRMLLYVVLPTLLIFALVISLGTLSSFDALRRAAEERLTIQASLDAARVEDNLERAILSVKRMAEAQVAGMFGNREASLELARLVLEDSPEFTGSYIGYEPDADQQDTTSLGKLPSEAMDEQGRFIPYWYVVPNQGRTIQLEPLVDLETSLYYQGAKDAYASTHEAAPLVTEPYIYQGKLIVEQVYPIIIDRKFKGITGVDFALADVQANLRKTAELAQMDLFLISSRGRFIAATIDPDRQDSTDMEGMLMTQAVDNTDYADVFADLLSVRKKPRLKFAVDPLDGQSYYFAAASIPSGGWTLILRESEAKILAPIWGELRYRLALALTGLAVIIGLLLVMSYRLGERVRVAMLAAERVARGDLTQEIKPSAVHDETGALLCSIHRMTANLNDLVGQVKQSSVQLNSTATELAATSRQQESNASTFGASTNQIAAATRQISATSSELVQTMQDVHDAAVHTAGLATSGRQGLQEMESNMQGLEHATSSIGDKLAVINQKANNITGVVTTITKVADQTNLLSVNAAIEAEKAGEYGVGFLVVAREIRRLADQTASATLDIEQMVQQMQAAVSEGVMEMDRFTDKVRRSVKGVEEISRQMEEIIERVKANTDRF